MAQAISSNIESNTKKPSYQPSHSKSFKTSQFSKWKNHFFSGTTDRRLLLLKNPIFFPTRKNAMKIPNPPTGEIFNKTGWPPPLFGLAVEPPVLQVTCQRSLKGCMACPEIHGELTSLRDFGRFFKVFFIHPRWLISQIFVQQQYFESNDAPSKPRDMWTPFLENFAGSSSDSSPRVGCW